MGEKWFQFVSRIKKEHGLASLKEAMAEASKRKSEWKKDDASPSMKTKKSKSSKKTKKGGKKARKSRRKC